MALDPEKNNKALLRKPFKPIENAALLFAGTLFIVAVLAGLANASTARKTVDSVGASEISLSEQTVAKLRSARTADNFTGNLVGQYDYLLNYGSDIIRGSVSINEDRISRLVELGSHVLSGNAAYRIEGETIQYSDIVGDRYLFSDEGSLVGVNETHGNFIEFDGRVSLWLETEFAPDVYEPLKIELPPLLDRIKAMPIWKRVQYGLNGLGLAILAYFVVLIIGGAIQRRLRKTHTTLFKA